MNPTVKPLSIEIFQLGSVAHQCFASDMHGKVFAVFSRAVYLLTDSNELIWIVKDDAPMHRRSIQIRAPLPVFQVGMSFHMEGQLLKFDPDYLLDASRSALWNMSDFHQAHMLDVTEVFPWTESFFLHLDLSQAKGFGNFIPLILSLASNPGTGIGFESTDPILLYAQPRIMRLVRACLSQNMNEAAKHAVPLIGLGSGLTPSGDDFVGGLMFALHVLENVYSDARFILPGFSVETLAPRTNLISYTLLQDFAHGHAIEPLHQIAYRLLSGESFESIYPFIFQLIDVGNSTGWDLLAGLLMGFLSLHQSSHQNITLPIDLRVDA